MRNVNAGQKRLAALDTLTIAQKEKLAKNREKSRRNMAAKRKRDKAKEDETNEELGPSSPLTTPKTHKCTAPYCGNITHNYYFCSECYYRKKYAGCDVAEEWAGF